MFNDRGSLELAVRVTDRARIGVVVALSIWWKKLARDNKNANELTHQRLTDIGRAPSFYDCLVEVEKLGVFAGLRERRGGGAVATQRSD
jgi:anaerobic selenocysteine-containing dehydrogenase